MSAPTTRETLRFEDVSGRAIENLKLKVSKVNWFSTYHVHHRVADHFRKGRAFILGDAAHIHSPAGGQGMNTGIGDAVNLAWKLAAVRAGPGRAERCWTPTSRSACPLRSAWWRRPTAPSRSLTRDGPLADIVRTRIAPLVLSRAFRVEAVREFMFRTVSQIMVNYRDRPLSVGKAGEVHGGDRLPWVAGTPADNHALTEHARHGRFTSTAPRAAAWGSGARPTGCRCTSLPGPQAHAEAGLARDALYLMRPDTYVALADGSGEPDALAALLLRAPHPHAELTPRGRALPPARLVRRSGHDGNRRGQPDWS